MDEEELKRLAADVCEFAAIEGDEIADPDELAKALDICHYNDKLRLALAVVVPLRLFLFERTYDIPFGRLERFLRDARDLATEFDALDEEVRRAFAPFAQPIAGLKRASAGFWDWRPDPAPASPGNPRTEALDHLVFRLADVYAHFVGPEFTKAEFYDFARHCRGAVGKLVGAEAIRKQLRGYAPCPYGGSPSQVADFNDWRRDPDRYLARHYGVGDESLF